jgi:hypothetical protein
MTVFGRGSARRKAATYAQTQNKRRQISMPWVEIRKMIPVLERVKKFHALNRAATVIGFQNTTGILFKKRPWSKWWISISVNFIFILQFDNNGIIL